MPGTESSSSSSASPADYSYVEYGIEIYDANGDYHGHFEVADETLQHFADVVQLQLANSPSSASAVAASETVAGHLDVISASCVVVCIALFAVLGAVSVVTLVRSLRVGR